MTQQEFLDENVFITESGTTINNDTTTLYFSEEAFAEILNKAEHYGVSIYDIKSTLNGEAGKSANHERYKKKATDSTWYRGVFKSFKNDQKGYLYAATYKVSKKLLSR
ncbi:hypothetical protein FHR24_001665 [Wenyingzhuangia heitensis]|uniref:Uncharacterized protein n=1 Tax=Wenyingzhuangia heitensis TaxID=1487859 RepID=A0ABX0UDI5_9FLAO|nr:hypothetical protein [Wenyingzhuangia heitensis]NIJ45226.1 hypothetical protein [Wenyingzhuangia heitensis]